MVENRKGSGNIVAEFILRVSTVLHSLILNDILLSSNLDLRRRNYLEMLYLSLVILGHIELVLNCQL